MSRPLAIDLFCGLPEPEFGLRANLVIKKLVARRAKNPNHVTLTIRHDSVRASARVFRFVGDFKNTIFAARLAGVRNVRVFAPQSRQPAIPIRTLRVIDFLDMRFLAVKFAALFTRSFARTLWRAVSLICARRENIEVLFTPPAIRADCGHVRLLTTPPPSDLGRAFRRTINFIRANRSKSRFAVCAG